MFDIGFSEIIVCAVVGLLVIGPERLPETVRTVGLWVGRIKRSLRETREELERQVGMEDVRRQLHTEEMMRTLADMQEEIDTALNYERMGKNKPVIESLTSPLPTGETILNEKFVSEAVVTETVVEKTAITDTKIAQEHLPNPHSDASASNDQIFIKTPTIKTLEKSETSIVHH